MGNFRYHKHDDIIQMLGGSAGFFQVMVFLASVISFATEGFLIYNLAFLNFLPTYICVNKDGSTFQCERLETCRPEYNDGNFYADKSKPYLENWIQLLNLRCVENWEIGMFGSIFFIGHVFGSYFLAEYGDTVGRILLIKIGQGTTLVSYALIIYVTRSVPVIYCLIFTFGMLSCWRLSLAYIYASEIVAESTQNFAGSLFNLFDS